MLGIASTARGGNRDDDGPVSTLVQRAFRISGPLHSGVCVRRSERPHMPRVRIEPTRRAWPNRTG